MVPQKTSAIFIIINTHSLNDSVSDSPAAGFVFMILLVSVAFFPVQEDGNYSQPNYIHFISSPAQLRIMQVLLFTVLLTLIFATTQKVCVLVVCSRNFYSLIRIPLYGISL